MNYEQQLENNGHVISWHGAIDALGRKYDADFLTSLLHGRFLRELQADKLGSLVININAPWGTGKTFLLERWALDLRDQGWTVLQFNAWEHDYSNDPLLSFISALDQQVQATQSVAKTAGAAAKKFSKSLATNLAPAIAKSAVQLGATLLFGPAGANFAAASKEAAESASKAIERVAEKLLEQEKALAHHLEKFKSSLAEFASSTTGAEGNKPTPLIILIDELDRCRPNFSIDLLEVIKHVFSVSGVYTVIATDTKQLASSAKHAYGSEFQGADYLKRFFDLQYELTEPDKQPLALHLLIKEGFSNAEGIYVPTINVRRHGRGGTGSLTPLKMAGDQFAIVSMAMFIAAISTQLALSNREMTRMIELMRAVADSFFAATASEFPKPSLHIVYLSMLAGAYMKDRSASSDKEIKDLFTTQNKLPSQNFVAGPEITVDLASLLHEYMSANVRGLSNRNFGNNNLLSEMAESLTMGRTCEHVHQYRSLVSRCGQIARR